MKNLAILLLISFTLYSEQFKISAVIIDKNGTPLVGANAVVLHTTDSSIVSGSAVNTEGKFEIKNINPGKYLLKTSCIGFEEKFQFVQINNSDLSLGKIQLKEKIISISEVKIQATIPPATLEGDTTSYSSKAFKTNPDATTEDLVAKIPGVTVDGSKVQAQGEDVKRVFVDGRQFFGDDPTAVLRNLPSEVVDKVQIFDEKSEQSKFTGFDDGNTSKAMNIVTKPQFRNGVFGKLSTMYGEDERYKLNTTINYFNNEQRITFLAQSNNINEQNFSPEDLFGASSGGGQTKTIVRGGSPSGGGGHRQFVSGGGGDLGQFLVDQKNGLTKTNAIGINFSDKLFNKIDLSGSYFFNKSENNTTSDLERQYLTGNTISSFIYNENTVSASDNTNHRLNFKIDYRIDSSNSLLIQPKLSAQNNNGVSEIFGTNYNGGIKTGDTKFLLNSDLKGANFSSSTLFRHKFETMGRTFSINFNPQISYNDGNSLNNNKTTSYGLINRTDTVKQSSNLEKTGKSFSTNFTFTEPIAKEHAILFRVDNSVKNNFSDKKTFDFDNLLNDYTKLDTAQTNKFTSTTTTNGAGVDYQFQTEAITVISGISFQNSNLKNDQSFPNQYLLNTNYKSILPSIMLTYKISKESNLRFNYRASTNIPSVDQLQEVLDISKPLQLSVGNPNLVEENSHFVNLRFMHINPAKNETFFAFVGGNFSNNYVANNTFFSEKDSILQGKYNVLAGTRFYTPINLDGQYSLRAFTLYGFMLPFINANLNLSSFVNYTNTPGRINGEINYAKNPSARINLVLSSSISEKLDYTFSSAATFNKTLNSLQKELDRDYSTQSTRFKINLLPWAGLVLSTDIAYQTNKGLGTEYNKNYTLWNASIGYKFLQNNRAELKFTVNDILNQNIAVSRNATDSYFEDVRTNALQRFFIFSFSYNLRSFPGGGERRMEIMSH